MNAKKEFLGRTKEFVVLCAILLQQADNYYLDEEEQEWKYILKKGYSDEDYQKFLKDIDFEYEAGYGEQRVDGTIWLSDGEWFDREEYDGSEWWQFHSYPEIPEELL